MEYDDYHNHHDDSTSGHHYHGSLTTTTSTSTTTTTTAAPVTTTNTTAATTTTTTTLPVSLTVPMTANPGWSLLASSVGFTPAEVFPDKQSGIISIWKWVNNNWAVFLLDDTTPGAYAVAKGFGQLEAINPGEGFWLNIAQ